MSKSKEQNFMSLLLRFAIVTVVVAHAFIVALGSVILYIVLLTYVVVVRK